MFFYTFNNLVKRIFLCLYFKKNICPVKACRKKGRIFKPQVAYYILPYRNCGSSSEGKAYRIWKLFPYRGNAHIVGPEVVSPFRNAVSFVDCNTADRYGTIVKNALHPFCCKSFRRNVDKLNLSLFKLLYGFKVIFPFK